MTRYKSHVALPDDARESLVRQLNLTLATTLDLHSQVKQAHWNTRGPWFFARHELYDRLADHLSGWADDAAERAGTLGGYAKGTVRMSSEISVLAEYDPQVREGSHHLRLLTERYVRYTELLREGIKLAQEQDDPATEDLFTGVLRAAELDLWFIESHLNEPR